MRKAVPAILGRGVVNVAISHWLGVEEAHGITDALLRRIGRKRSD